MGMGIHYHLNHYGPEYIIWCEAAHSLLGLVVASVAFFLISIIWCLGWRGICTSRSLFLLSLFLGSLSHWIADVEGWGF